MEPKTSVVAVNRENTTMLFGNTMARIPALMAMCAFLVLMTAVVPYGQTPASPKSPSDEQKIAAALSPALSTRWRAPHSAVIRSPSSRPYAELQNIPPPDVFLL